jgi:hypothetical protein
MGYLLILGVSVLLIYAIWRAVGGRGIWVVALIAGCIAAADALSIFTEPYLGSRSFNFAHHDQAHAWQAIAMAAFWISIAMVLRIRRTAR